MQGKSRLCLTAEVDCTMTHRDENRKARAERPGDIVRRHPTRVWWLRPAVRHSSNCISARLPLSTTTVRRSRVVIEQAVRCFEVILEAVEALGGTREDILRTTVFVIDVANWDAVGRAHGEFFGQLCRCRGLDPGRSTSMPRLNWSVDRPILRTPFRLCSSRTQVRHRDILRPSR